MRKLCLLLITVFWFGACAFAQVQILNQPESPKLNIESLKPQQKESKDSLHKFLCRRCGSENHYKWDFPGHNESLQLIPHCGFCGKKYWPKFKPTEMLNRTYCKTDWLPTRLRPQQSWL